MTDRIDGFDAHMHLNDPAFQAGREEILHRLALRGYEGAVSGWDIPSSETALELASRHTNLHAAVGIHPCYLPEDPDGAMRRLRELAASGARAIGECGLDETGAEPMDKQIGMLNRQLDLACQIGLPVVLHVRGRHGAMLSLLKKRTTNPPLLLHGASLGRELLREYLGLGCLISVGGMVARERGKRAQETAGLVPPDRLLIETDCPWQAPVPGRQSQPEDLAVVSHAVAKQRNTDGETVLKVTRENAHRFFGLPLEERG